MRLALAQMNPTVGDIGGNAARALSVIERARRSAADVIITPELLLSGYPPRDLLLQEGFLDEVAAAARGLAASVTGIVAIVGAPWPLGAAAGDRCANSLLVMQEGRITARYDKRLLPTYDVFDEDRYFTPGDRPMVIDAGGVRVGLSICEDLWRGEDVGVEARYRERSDPAADLLAHGARLIVNPSASPFALGKGRRQRDVLIAHARRHGVAIAAVNQVGGNDDLIFDGHAAVFAPDPSSEGGARLVAAGPGFREDLLLVDLPGDAAAWSALPAVPDPLLGAEEERLLWDALTLGIRDYCRKTGFSGVVLGLSGGVDSSLAACLAVGALGASNVLALSMPSRFSSEGSRTDAKLLASALGVRLVTTAIERPHALMEELLTPDFERLGASGAPGVAEENVQSRLRGLILMAYSNKLGLLPLTTGNKSELGVGYCTLYGDMNGGLAVLADLTKGDVYRLSKWINRHPDVCGVGRPPIPAAVLTKPPSAELRPDQTDQDTLPPYDALDEVLDRWIVGRQSAARIARETGLGPADVSRIIRMVGMSEHKRRQAPIGLKVTDVAFGAGRRMPVAQGWRPAT